jgi:hypothetical protein
VSDFWGEGSMSRASSQPPTGKPQVPEQEIRAWSEEYRVPCTTNAEVLSAFETLTKAGVSPTQLMLVLELLRAYVDRRVFEKAERDFDDWADKAKSLARRLRSIAPKARELLFNLDPEFVESLSQTADNIENYPRIVVTTVGGDPFARSLAGTTRFLVLAVELIRKITTRPHYKEVADLLHCIASATPVAPIAGRERSESSISKAVANFKDRQPQFAENLLRKGKVENQARAYVAEWQSAERRLKSSILQGTSKNT